MTRQHATQLPDSAAHAPSEGGHTGDAATEPQKRSQRLMRVGFRVRSLIDDQFVTVGQTGVVTSVVHPGYAGNVSGGNLVRVDWDNSTRSRVPVTAVEVIQPAALTTGGVA